VDLPDDEPGGHDGVLAQREELAWWRDEHDQTPVEPADGLDGRGELELEPGGALHAHGLAELGDDRVLSRVDREDTQRREPDQDCAEAEESQEPDAARETDGGQHSTPE